MSRSTVDLASVDRFGADTLSLARGWTREYLVPPSRLYGANGIRSGADGRIYVAQLAGCRVSAVDIDSGAIEHLATTGSEIIGPDDLAFDEFGNMFITEFTENRVSMRSPDGKTRVLQGDIQGANPITYHQGRLIAGECRHDARIMELDRAGGAPRIILDHVPMTNAFEVGPDGKLYFPVMETSEIWRVNLDGSDCEVVIGDLGVPDSVKFDSKGRIVSTQVGSGQVLRIDPQSATRELLAEIGPGLDNSTFVGDRLFVSHMTGSIHEIVEPGKVRELNPKGLLWPMGVAAAADGSVYVADGSYAYVRPAGGTMVLAGMIFTPGFPTFHRGAAAAGEGVWLVTTSLGEVRSWRPAAQTSEVLASGYDKLMGIAIAPDGCVVFAESGRGRVLSLKDGEVSVLASGLDTPTGLAIDAGGTIHVSESGAGRVARLCGGRNETVIDGLHQPEGLTERGGKVYVIDVLAHELLEIDAEGNRRMIAGNLPVGAPSGPRPYLGPAGEFSGPMVSLAGLAAGPDGTLYVGADGNGSVMALHPSAG
jgi:sugar lactone lactonase YvrE